MSLQKAGRWRSWSLRGFWNFGKWELPGGSESPGACPYALSCSNPHFLLLWSEEPLPEAPAAMTTRSPGPRINGSKYHSWNHELVKIFFKMLARYFVTVIIKPTPWKSTNKMLIMGRTGCVEYRSFLVHFYFFFNFSITLNQKRFKIIKQAYVFKPYLEPSYILIFSMNDSLEPGRRLSC